MISDEKMSQLLQFSHRGCESEISPEEMARLDSLLIDDAEAQRCWLLLAEQDMHLAWLANSDGVETLVAALRSTLGAESKPTPVASFLIKAKQALSPPVVWSIAGCGVLFVAYFIAISWGIISKRLDHSQLAATDRKSEISEDRSQILPVATLTYVEGCQWQIHGQPVSLRQGTKLLAKDKLSLISGTAEVAFADGANVVLEGPATFVVESSGRGKLDRGKLVAKVPQRAIGFIINTPTAEIIDLGTEFGVEVGEFGESDVHVFQGRVVAEIEVVGQAEPQCVELKESEAARFVADKSIQVSKLSVAPGRFKFQAAKRTRDPLIGLPAPLARWDFNGNAEELVTSSDERYAATIANSQGLRRIRGGLEFLGDDRTYVDLGDSAALSPEQITVAFWLKLPPGDSDLAEMAILSKRRAEDNEVSERSWEIAVDLDNRLFFRIYSDQHLKVGHEVALSHVKNWRDGRWHHVAATFDGKQGALYVDGRAIDRRQYAGKPNSLTAPLYLGQYPYEPLQTGNAFRGQIGGPLLIFDAGLSERQVLQLFRGSPP